MMKKHLNKQIQRGVVAVEFALLIIPMLLMVFGVAEYGRAMYQYNTLVKATRDGARYLTTQAAGSGVNTAKCLVVYGQAVCSGPKVVGNLTTSMVSVCDSVSCPSTHAAVATGSGVVNLVTVVISGYQFESAVSFNIGGLTIGLPNITFGDISTTMRQVL